jgi:hypothetical protein
MYNNITNGKYFLMKSRILPKKLNSDEGFGNVSAIGFN